MMLGDSSSTLLGSSSAGDEIGGGGGGGVDVGSNYSASEDDNNNKLLGRNDDGGRSFSGNRWPRQETLALLNIRSDMNQVFRDSSLKGPLWEEVSKKLGELGYNRSAKKCKEKFENVYKYHKRTKDGRTGKPEGKHYKFFDQLQALDHQTKPHHHHQQAPLMQATQAIQWTMNPPSSLPHINVAVPQNAVVSPPTNPTVSAPAPPPPQPLVQALNNNNNNDNLPCSFANMSMKRFSSSTSSSSSTASEEYSEERRRGAAGTRKKRKWKMFFKKLTKQVIKKQEELQDKFLKEIERRELERIAREDAWQIQEISRINREHEILIQERSTSAAKDAAVISFLQNISGFQLQQTPVKETPQQQSVVQPAPAPAPEPAPAPAPAPAIIRELDATKQVNYNYGEKVIVSSSRWPKAEVEALIKFRTELANKYQENGPKGPLWEEISAAMRSVGYNRNAKRCKEKWENINKYFKKVKESNKKRPEDSKTCPYFDQLDALYKEKNNNSAGNVKAVNQNMAPLMVQPEQQYWPANQEDEGDSSSEEINYEEDDREGNGGYEIVPNKSPAAVSMGNAE